MRRDSKPRSSTPFATAVLVVLVALLGLVGAPSGATSIVLSQELPDLVRESSRAALVTVVDVRYGLDDRNLHSTWVKLRVDEPLYGANIPGPGAEFTIKLYGASETMPDGSRLFVDGTPEYRSGERYLLLLNNESPWGFTSAAGHFQGAFRIVDNARGRSVARNVSPRSRLFGSGGIASHLDADSLSTTDRVLLERSSDVPYSMLREAVLGSWQALGGRSWTPPARNSRLDGGAR